MCGRYSLIADLGELARRFEFDGDWLTFESSYNIAPTQEVMTVVGGESRRAGYMRWGLIPSWAKDPSIGSRMINARAETVAVRPAFRTALRRRRCLVIADGFYEWQKSGSRRRPMRVVMRSREPFAPYPPPNGSKGSGVADLELVGESAGSKCLDLMANGSETVPGSVRQTILADVGHSAACDFG